MAAIWREGRVRGFRHVAGHSLSAASSSHWHRPDLWIPAVVTARRAVGDEGDDRTVGREGRLVVVVVAACQLAGLTRAQLVDEQVVPTVEPADSIELVKGAPHHSRHVSGDRVVLLLVLGTLNVHHEHEPVARRRPLDPLHRTGKSDRRRLTAVERSELQLSQAALGREIGQEAAIGRPARQAIVRAVAEAAGSR